MRAESPGKWRSLAGSCGQCGGFFRGEPSSRPAPPGPPPGLFFWGEVRTPGGKGYVVGLWPSWIGRADQRGGGAQSGDEIPVFQDT
eukprot:scaffold56520_cov51-Phaeocystis_antarctica.AAC.3